MIRLKKLNIVKEVASELAAHKLEELGYERIGCEKVESKEPPKKPMQEDKLPPDQPPTPKQPPKQPKKAKKGKTEQKADEQGGSENNDSGFNQSDDASRADKADNGGGNGQP